MPTETINSKIVKPDTLSVCMIVKNEADLLARCLDSIKGVADELIVVDTGSSDTTVSIAQSFGAKVICTGWRNDFAWARNLSIKDATSAWILWLDADDVVPSESIPVLASLKLEKPDHIIGLTVRNQRSGNTGTEFIQARMFPNRPDLYFERRIHEQIMPSALRIGMKMENRSAVVEHHGYADPATMKKKALRNVQLLLEDYNDSDPDAVTTVEIADSYQLTEDYDAALIWYKRTLAIPNCESATPSIAGHAHLGLGTIYNLRSEYSTAIDHLKQASDISPWRPDVLYSLAVAVEQNGEPQKAVDILKKILTLKTSAGQVGVDFRATKIKTYLRLVRLLVELENLEYAAEITADSLAAEPLRPELYNSAGKFLIKCGKPIDALKTFEKSIILVKQGNLDAYIGLCIIYVKACMTPKAIETIDSLAVDFSENNKYQTFRSYLKGITLTSEQTEILVNLRREFFNVF
ncbi:MAG: glycosyltransferase [Fibrobacterota bacterium]